MKTSIFLAPTCLLLGAAANAQVTSVANGEWTNAATWSDSTAPGAGQTYQVTSGFTVDSPVGANNSTTTFGGDSLEVQSGGILRLRHTSAGGNTTVNINTKPLTLAAGSTFQSYNTSLGNVTRNLTSAVNLDTTGTVNFFIQSDNSSAYANRLNLQGVLSGSATIDLKGVLQGQGGERRTLSVGNGANTFTGNWLVEGTNTTDNARRLFLEANAANALGSGTVTLTARSHLRVTSAGSINNISGITLAAATTNLQLLNAGGWVNPSAPLTVNGGAVALGAGASSIGNLSGTGGSITGEGVASGLTVNQTTNGTYAGSLAFTAGNGLAFTKGGAADLRLTGTINAAVPVTLNAGGLGIGSSTVASLTQNGGSLLLNLGTASNDHPVITGNYSRTTGDIAVQVTSQPVLDTPYTLVTYQGALTSNPPVTVSGLGASRVSSAVNYGTGSNSAITLTFSGTPASIVWQGNAGNFWDVNSTGNWSNSGNPDNFFQLDNVSFTDDATGTTDVQLDEAVSPGSVVFNHSSKNYSLSGNGSIGGTATLTKSGDGTLTISNNNLNSGTTTISGGTLQLGSGGTSGSLGTGAVNNSGTLAFNRSDSFTFANAISGPGAVSQLGSGTTILLADNTYTGATTVTAGTLQVGNGGATGSLGSTSSITTHGTLAFNRSGTLTLTPEITGTGALLQSGPGTIVLAAGASHTGGTTVAAGTLVLGTGTTVGSITGPVTNNGTFAIHRSDATLEFANVVSGTGLLDHRGSGILRLTGANTYTGTTGVSGGGTLELDSAGSSIPSGTGLVLASGKLDFNDLDLTVSSFTKAPAGSVEVTADPGKSLTVEGGNFLVNQGGLNMINLDSLVFNQPGGSFNAVTTANNGATDFTAAYVSNSFTAATFGIANGGGSGSNYTSGATVTLGQTNAINADTILIGTNGAESGTAILRCIDNDSTLTIRGTAGGSSRANMTVGYKSGSDYAGGASSVEVSGSGSTLDAMLGSLVIGRHGGGTGNFDILTSGSFIFGEGTLDATSIVLGIGEAPANKTASGTLGTTGGLIRTETLTLVQDSGGAIGTATVNVEGAGTLEASTITGQVAANATVSLKDSAVLQNTPSNNLTVTRTTLDIASTAAAALVVGSGNDAFFDASAFKFRYFSDAVDPDFAKLTVSGAATLSETTLALVDENTTPVAFTVGQKFVLIDYAAGSLSGTFAGLDDGEMFQVGSQFFVIDYNDPAHGGQAVTLTVPEANTYASWAAINAGAQGGDEDYDKDGVPNAIEYLMGETGSTFTSNPQVVSGKITWPKDPDALATWVVQTSSSLAAEGQPGGWTDATAGVSDLDTSIEFTLPEGDSRIFVRLKVSVP